MEEAGNRCSGMEGQLRLPVEGLPQTGGVTADERKAAAVELRETLKASDIRCGGGELDMERAAVQNFRECVVELKAVLRRVRAELEPAEDASWMMEHYGWTVRVAQRNCNIAVLDFVPADGAESARAAAAMRQRRASDRVEQRRSAAVEGCFGGCRSRASGGRQCELWR